MPSCNLAEIVYNAWLQQSGKKGRDLYAATADDLIRALQQQTRYRSFLRGGLGGKGPNKSELMLRAARRSGNPSKIARAVSICADGIPLVGRVPHLEGKERFGSCKRKLDTPPGSDADSHRADRVNFSTPRIPLDQRWNCGTSTGEGHSAPNRTHASSTVTAMVEDQNMVPHVMESMCLDEVWHIERTSAGSRMKCAAIRATNHEKCTSLISRGKERTAAPTFTGLFLPYGQGEAKNHKIWFCADDCGRCMRGTVRPSVVRKPTPPTVWPVKMGTGLTHQEIAMLEEAGFSLARHSIAHRGASSSSGSRVPPRDAHLWPTRRNGKLVRRFPPTAEHYGKIESARMLHARVAGTMEVPDPGYGRVFTMISSASALQDRTYDITVFNFPNCTCPDFSSLGKRGKFIPCKHLYFIFLRRMVCDPKRDFFIHQATMSFNEVNTLLQRDTSP